MATKKIKQQKLYWSGDTSTIRRITDKEDVLIKILEMKWEDISSMLEKYHNGENISPPIVLAGEDDWKVVQKQLKIKGSQVKVFQSNTKTPLYYLYRQIAYNRMLEAVSKKQNPF